MKLDIQVGDTVYIWKWVGPTRHETTGVVQEIRKRNPMRREALVNGDWYILRNDLRNGLEVIKKRAEQS